MDFRVGARVGPFMVSAPLGGRGKPELFHPAPLGQVCGELRADGWKLSSPADGVVYASKGWTTLRVEQTARGVRARRSMNTRVVLVVLAASLLLVAVCCAPGFYEAART